MKIATIGFNGVAGDTALSRHHFQKAVNEAPVRCGPIAWHQRSWRVIMLTEGNRLGGDHSGFCVHADLTQ